MQGGGIVATDDMLGPVSCRCTPVTSIIGLVLVYALIRAYNDGRLTFPFDRRSPYLSPTLDHPLPPSSLTYVAAAAAFIGGYTVAGNAIVSGGAQRSSELTSFEVGQECVCTCTPTSTGIFCKGANDDNAFALVAAQESDGRWYAQQASIGVSPGYQARMDFGAVPGGAHSAAGFYLNPNAAGEQTVFRAQQSAIGCAEGVGATACKSVCGAFDLPWDQIQKRCGL